MIGGSGILGGDFSPLDIESVVAWWSPDSGVTMDGSGLVSSWVDRVAGHEAIQATAANKPTWRASAATMLGGKRPLMHFTDTNRFLEMAAFPATMPLGAAETWLFAASRLTGTGSGATSTIIGYGGQRGMGAAGVEWNTIDPTQTNRFSVMRSAGSDAMRVAPSMLTNAVVGAKFGPDIVGRRNGAQVGTSSDGTSITTGNLRLGRRTNGVDNIVGYVGDIAVFGALTLADVERIEGWLAWRYDQQALLVTGHPYKNNPP